MNSGSVGLRNPSELYLGLLKSQAIADRLVDRFSLLDVYDVDTRYEAREKLEARTKITAGREGIVTIAVEDRDRNRAADLANAYVHELNELTETLALTEAGQRRRFFERQLQIVNENLAKAEYELKQTQETTGFLRLDEQGRAIIEAVARTQALITAKEVQIKAMRTFAAPGNSDLARVEEELSALRSELKRLEGSKPLDSGIIVPTQKVPASGMEYVRRVRSVKYHETVLELVARQFEIAKIDEAKDTAIIQVLDVATVPEKRSWPKPIRFTVIAAVAYMLGGLALALLLDNSSRDPQASARWRAVASGLWPKRRSKVTGQG
jgi:uncharacterized protein involved in exopolysaccharide biosynthesis